MQKDIYFPETNINLGDKSHFTVLGKFTFLIFKSESILVRGFLHRLSSLRLMTGGPFLRDVSLFKPPAYLSPTALSPLRSPLARGDGPLLTPSGRVGGTVSQFLLLQTYGLQLTRET